MTRICYGRAPIERMFLNLTRGDFYLYHDYIMICLMVLSYFLLEISIKNKRHDEKEIFSLKNLLFHFFRLLELLLNYLIKKWSFEFNLKLDHDV